MNMHILISKHPGSLSLNNLMLRRLAIMAPLAAYKFRRIPIENLEREQELCFKLKQKCMKAHLSSQKTEAIINILKENFTLSKIIQRTLMEEWEEKNHIPILAGQGDSIELFRKELDQITEKLGDELIRLTLTKNQSPYLPEEIHHVLVKSYPSISSQQLIRSLKIIKQCLNKLDSE